MTVRGCVPEWGKKRHRKVGGWDKMVVQNLEVWGTESVGEQKRQKDKRQKNIA